MNYTHMHIPDNLLDRWNSEIIRNKLFLKSVKCQNVTKIL